MSVTEQFRDFAASIHCAFKEGEPLSAYTTFHIGGPAELMLFPGSREMLRQLLAFCAQVDTQPFILGKGSNLLVADRGLSGVTICTDRMLLCQQISETQIECEAGLPLVKLCMAALNGSLSGMEFAYGIPGSVGGAVFMNAGAYGGEMKDVVSSCVCVDKEGKEHTLSAKELAFDYRTSVLQKNGWVVSSVCVSLQKGDSAQIRAKMDDFLSRRKDKQPLNFPSAGSAFKRPQGHFAGALIEQCGLKGFSVGGAQVSEKHAGFIVNRGGASARDVLHLVEYIQKTVQGQTGVLLEPEIKYISK